MDEDEFNENEENVYDQKNYADTETLKNIYYRQFWNLFDEYCNAEKKDFVKTKLQDTINNIINEKELIDKKTFLSKQIDKELFYAYNDSNFSVCFSDKEDNDRFVLDFGDIGSIQTKFNNWLIDNRKKITFIQNNEFKLKKNPNELFFNWLQDSYENYNYKSFVNVESFTKVKHTTNKLNTFSYVTSEFIKVKLFKNDNKLINNFIHSFVHEVVDNWNKALDKNNDKNYLEKDESKIEEPVENKKSDMDLYNDFLEKLTKQSAKKRAKSYIPVEKDETDFVRSYSLTEKEVDKMNDWKENHYNKYHKKDDEKKFKKNPFYGGVSPVSIYRVEWMSCSIGTSADCVCVECSKKCDKLNRKINKLNKKLCSTKEKNKREQISKKIVNITSRNKEIYDESRFCVRELDS